MAYIDPDSVHVPTTGRPAPAAWGLAVADDLVHLADRPACQARAATAQDLPNAEQIYLSAPVTDFDTDGMLSPTVDTRRVTAVTPGRYLLWATVEISAPADAGPVSNLVGRFAFVPDDTSRYVARDSRPLLSGATPLRISIAAVEELNVGDNFLVNAFQNSGADGTALLLAFGALLMTR